MSEYGFCSSHPPHGQQRVWVRLSSLTRNGMWNNVQLQKLADEKMEVIEDIIRCLYKSKVKNVHSLWEGCRISIGKKCQSLRKGQTDE